MSTASCIGRIGTLAIALGVTAAIAAAPAASPPVKLAADESPVTPLILCGTTCPTPDQYWLDTAMNQFVRPTHPGVTFTDPVAVTAPQEFWPITGVMRVLGLVVGPADIFGLDGPAWPDEPLWKLSGLFDRTANNSLQGGVDSLEAAIAANGGDHLVVYGYSQGAGIANVVKKKLAQQYPKGTEAPDIDFVLGGDPNLPNGGLMERFSGLYIPILDLTFNGAAATDTQFDTVEISRQYDGFSDFPLYPLNVVADLNAVLGMFYVHTYGFDVDLSDPAQQAAAYQGTHGDTSYYFVKSQDLPLFGPLRTLGVPEKYIDVVEPVAKVIVDLGYDRSIPPWEPTPARVLPTKIDLGQVAGDLVGAVGEGIDNARALIPGSRKGADIETTSGAASLPVAAKPAAKTAPLKPAKLNEFQKKVTGKFGKR